MIFGLLIAEHAGLAMRNRFVLLLGASSYATPASPDRRWLDPANAISRSADEPALLPRCGGWRGTCASALSRMVVGDPRRYLMRGEKARIIGCFAGEKML